MFLPAAEAATGWSHRTDWCPRGRVPATAHLDAPEHQQHLRESVPSPLQDRAAHQSLWQDSPSGSESCAPSISLASPSSLQLFPSGLLAIVKCWWYIFMGLSYSSFLAGVCQPCQQAGWYTGAGCVCGWEGAPAQYCQEDVLSSSWNGEIMSSSSPHEWGVVWSSCFLL